METFLVLDESGHLHANSNCLCKTEELKKVSLYLEGKSFFAYFPITSFGS